MKTYYVKEPTGRYRKVGSDEVISTAHALVSSKFRKGAAISDFGMTKTLFFDRMATLEHEEFAVLFLNNRHRIIEFTTMFRGTIDKSSVWPREVAKHALRLNAAAVILGHNHPSGDPAPSMSDAAVTRQIVGALNLIDVRVLDHIVVGTEGCLSFAETGRL